MCTHLRIYIYGRDAHVLSLIAFGKTYFPRRERAAIGKSYFLGNYFFLRC